MVRHLQSFRTKKNESLIYFRRGVSDSQSWRGDSSPVLFDQSFQPKEAYTSLVSLLQG